MTFEALRSGSASAPPTGGAYVVMRPSANPVSFLAANPAGRFKGRDPSVAVEVLRDKWLAGCEVVYIGKGDDIRRRLKQYAEFGAGRPIGHWGGRYIWQLSDANELVVAWKPCASEETAGMMEARLLRGFKDEHGGRLPFANIADPT